MDKKQIPEITPNESKKITDLDFSYKGNIQSDKI